ncbi:MAG: prepilin-type N-terminal cleavage/methylation domain-containing protein [Phycisphaeraceae bacterium]|nr:prepilin-type N-terminal cleavage/methylation domain-containing protein [Phycisphaeraceae bacterium]
MTRRGLTLLEVVLATALLALAVAGVASAMSSITRPSAQPSVEVHTLASMIDDVLQNPSRHAFDASAIAKSGRGSLELDGITIGVTLKTRSGRGAWMEFAHGGQRIARWVSVPEERP